MKFKCSKCGHDVMTLTNSKEVAISEFYSVSHLHDIYKRETNMWVQTCRKCGYGCYTDKLTDLFETLKSKGELE
jgi:predicted nucleic-acid-binding Zn-ribbon protein